MHIFLIMLSLFDISSLCLCLYAFKAIFVNRHLYIHLAIYTVFLHHNILMNLLSNLKSIGRLTWSIRIRPISAYYVSCPTESGCIKPYSTHNFDTTCFFYELFWQSVDFIWIVILRMINKTYKMKERSASMAHCMCVSKKFFSDMLKNYI